MTADTDPTGTTDATDTTGAGGTTAGTTESPEAGGCGGCGCGAGGCGSGARVPELDARTIDPMIRQAAVFGVLIGLPPGSGATIVTDTAPDLVLSLIEGQFSGQYAVEAGRLGEAEWRTTFTRLA